MIKMVKKEGPFEKIYEDIVNDNEIKRPLFHGTRKWLAESSEEQLNDIRDKALKLIEFVQTKYFESINDKKQIEEFLFDVNLYTKYHCKNGPTILSIHSSDNYKYGCKSYEYGDVYVTNKIEKAIDFSCYIGGELLDYAYCASSLIKHFNYMHDDEIEIAINTVNELYNKHHNDERIVLIIDNVSINDLLTREGKPFDKEEYTIWKWNNHSLDFRIVNIDKYEFEYITEDMFVDYLMAYEENIDLINGFPANYFNLELRNDCLKKAEDGSEESYGAQRAFVRLCLEIDKDENKAIMYAKKWADQGNNAVKNYMTKKGYKI